MMQADDEQKGGGASQLFFFFGYLEHSQDLWILRDVLDSKQHSACCCLMTSKHQCKDVTMGLFQQSCLCGAWQILVSHVLHVVSISVFVILRPWLADHFSFKCLHNPCCCLQKRYTHTHTHTRFQYICIMMIIKTELLHGCRMDRCS